jgi:hypothetical protein
VADRPRLLSLSTLTGGLPAFDRAERADAIRILGVRGMATTRRGRVLFATTTPPRVTWLGFRLILPGGVIEDVPLTPPGRASSRPFFLALSELSIRRPPERWPLPFDNQQKYDDIADGGVLANQMGEDLSCQS